MWLVDTFDDFHQYLQLFEDAEVIGTFDGLIFKRKTGPISLCLGLFEGERLVAYSWMMKFTSRHNLIHGFELRVDKEYQRRGIAMFFYLHVLMCDKTRVIVSDYSHNPQSGALWNKMQTMSELQVGTYNRLTDTIDWSYVDMEKVYGNHHIHLIVRAK
jgi:GNAT superfamily N-acetyltransferase